MTIDDQSGWPRVIAHVDGDAFFASVEQAVNPRLKNKPIATGAERGIVVAMSYEAKALGVVRGMPVHQLKKTCPACIFVPSQYNNYELFSRKMMQILRNMSPLVEKYSIDEAFCDLTGLCALYHMTYEQIAHTIQLRIWNEVNISVSIGLSITKSLSKICSAFQKPNGITVVNKKNRNAFLQTLPIHSIWGIGQKSAALLKSYGIYGVSDFCDRPELWVRSKLGKVGVDIWRELHGHVSYPMNAAPVKPSMSISRGRTFERPSSNKYFVWGHALRNLEVACVKARKLRARIGSVELKLKTQSFISYREKKKLSVATSFTNELIPMFKTLFESIYQPRTLYRATTIYLYDLKRGDAQLDLFDDSQHRCNNELLFKAIDTLTRRYGTHLISFADSAVIGSGKKENHSRAFIYPCSNDLLSCIY